MSNSFIVKAADKAAVVEAVMARFAEEVSRRPEAEHDNAQVLANADTAVCSLDDDEASDVVVTVTKADGEGACISATAYLERY